MGTLLKALLSSATGALGGFWGYAAAAGFAAVVAGTGAGWTVHAVDLGTINGMKAAQAQAVADASSAAFKEQRSIDARNWSAAAAEVTAQGSIAQNTRTITKEVTQYVHDYVPVPGPTQTVTVGCITYGFVRVLDAAVFGVDPASLPLASGQSDDACTSIDAAALARAIVGNYGIARSNAEQLDALIAAVKANDAQGVK